MREILFKARRADNGEWVEGYYVKHGNCNWIYTGEIKIDYDSRNQFGQPCSDGVRFLVSPKTICQYTEMTDKNKKRIWKHDIVRAWSEGSCAVGEVMQRIDGLWIIFPAWQGREFWGLCPNEEGETVVEVLGNVFDNPNLLKGGDDT